ncbi:DUF6268 family outer membrane beta-barrel protein [Leeuwenhoekiella marinoflava]|uniref:DUF6268 domain-containing protein n=2 Tax=Leeuwenhoekiella marinoflava TaxID=988 RepID=A0A4V1KSN1_9FLAO|nr:DUF6268 family outer membrane beta-barrel protein [Leeuwenhoekiella marinoflava]RXG32318.1 hypothetical protein DSL99_1124 [Leeuwenhoekiella marinoflava]SHE79306.1 hypothetical protein SAMN02745246_01035 [Leeuwenhoekiella marinoflava DSM 3653]
MHRYIMVTLLIAVGKIGFGQEHTAQVNLDYALVPETSKGVSMQSFNVEVSLPVSLGAVTLKPAVGLRNYDMEYWDTMNFNTEPVEKIDNVFAGLNANYAFTDAWSLDANAEASWASGLNLNELVLTGNTYFTYTLNKKSPVALQLGAQYDSHLGDLQLLPLVELAFSMQRFHIKLGFPEIRIAYQLSENSRLSTGYSFKGDYFYMPQAIDFNTVNYADQAAIRQQKLSLTYDYHLDDNWSFSLCGGYLFQNHLQFYEDTQKVYDLDMGSGPVFSTGIKFNFSNNKHETND